MNVLILTFLAVVSMLLATTNAQPIDVNDAAVEIEKQRLVKFPEDVEQRRDEPEPSVKKDKNDEAKRILEEIEKINHALGYVKKPSVQQTRTPPILDSSQYLFPKPAYHPFHEQSHQMAGRNGETILIPSIRALKFDQSYPIQNADKSLDDYNIPPARKHTQKAQSNSNKQIKQSQVMTLKEYQEYLQSEKATASRLQQLKRQQQSPKVQYFYRPNQVEIPAPQNNGEQQQLPTHFVIPVRLYRLNKEEYLKKHAPQEYRVKGYKIVGDIDNFYGKAKSKNKGKGKKSTPKYHLFFLPSDMALNDDSTLKYPKVQNSSQVSVNSRQPQKQHDLSSREEKLASRPFKIQATATATSNSNNNYNAGGAGATNTSSTTQVIRKRIVPKPLREKETNINSVATQQLPGGGLATTATTIHITPPSIPMSTNINAANIAGIQGSGVNAQGNGLGLTNNNNFNLFNLRPNGANNLNSNLNTNPNVNPNDVIKNNTASNASNAIKLAFQNIFKFPFRQDAAHQKPDQQVLTETPNLETVPLQLPPKTFFTSQSLLPQLPLYNAANNNNYNNNANAPQSSHDYKWDDDSNSNSNDDYDENTTEQTEKGIFAHHLHNQQETQKEAIKQGGIIIQRLKVRKGGIAIAGPGGVATAGSGGTAIVGPGGYALTHPRSLTIAGPGAKIIAIPPSIDLQDALQRTNLLTRSFPREGKIVATGPTIYYSPATTSTGSVVEI